jgi:Fur family transcriptional regulator, ferric uptake regulator
MTADGAKTGDRLHSKVAGFSHRTRQREAILQSLTDHPGFVSAQTLHTRLRAGGEHIGLSTVYRTLHALARAGLVDVVRDAPPPATGGQLFRARPSDGHQHYLVCRDCGHSVTITSPTVESWATGIGHDHDFTDVHHVIELTGLCADCRSTGQDPRDTP